MRGLLRGSRLSAIADRWEPPPALTRRSDACYRGPQTRYRMVVEVSCIRHLPVEVVA
jgi:hypothetical protein